MSATTMPSSLMPACRPLAMMADTYSARVGVISIFSPEVVELTEVTEDEAAWAGAAWAVVDVEQVEVCLPSRQARAVV